MKMLVVKLWLCWALTLLFIVLAGVQSDFLSALNASFAALWAIKANEAGRDLRAARQAYAVIKCWPARIAAMDLAMQDSKPLDPPDPSAHFDR